MLRTRHGMQLPAERKEAVLLETALLAVTQASALTLCWDVTKPRAVVGFSMGWVLILPVH